MKVREIALNLLDQYENDGKYVNLSLQSHIADALSVEERALLTRLLYTTVEKKITYDYYISYLSARGIGDIDTTTKNALRLGLCQILDMDTVPDFAAVNETVDVVRMKSAKGFVNGVLRRAVKEKASLPLPPREKNVQRHLSVKYSYPLHLVKRLVSVFGIEETEQIFKAYNENHGLSLSVNTCKISREDYLRLLSAAGYNAEPSPYSSISVRIKNSCNPRLLPGFEDGYFFVQDDACAAAVEVLGINADDTVVDVCACPGGKSFAAAILGKDTARVYSYDVSDSKLPLISSGRDRLSLTSIVTKVHDATVADSELIGVCNKVICDVPCSGFGVIAKKPDLRYKPLDSYDTLPALQYQILAESAKYLSVGGEMIYSTCTLLPEENADTLRRFIAEHPNFSTVDFTVVGLSSEGGTFTFLPHKHGTDGFFVAKIKRTK